MTNGDFCYLLHFELNRIKVKNSSYFAHLECPIVSSRLYFYPQSIDEWKKVQYCHFHFEIKNWLLFVVTKHSIIGERISVYSGKNGILCSFELILFCEFFVRIVGLTGECKEGFRIIGCWQNWEIRNRLKTTSLKNSLTGAEWNNLRPST